MVLPAPGGPTSATVSPGRTVSEKPLSTGLPPVVKRTLSKRRPAPSTGPPVASRAGASPSTSSRRSNELMPICSRTYWLVSMDSIDVMEVRYAVNATNWPMVICPRIASMPPAMMVTTSATLGSCERIGWNRAVSFAARIFTAYRWRPSWSKRSISRCSWPNALTTRTPETVCSTCSASSAVACWLTHVAA